MTNEAHPLPPLVEFRDVTLEVDGQLYLRRANLEVYRGESLVVAGLPGSGKSFVIRLMLGLPGLTSASRVQFEGEVWVDGRDLTALSTSELQQLRARIGTVLRGGGLIENMDVRRNITLPLTYHHRKAMGGAEIDGRCELLLADLGIAHLSRPGLRPVGLNREERAYVALARALANEPFLLLLDDPAAGLSPGRAARLSESCLGYYPRFPTHPAPLPVTGQPLTRVVTTSDLSRYLEWGDRFAVLWQQQLHVVGGRDEVALSAERQVRELLSPERSTAGATRSPVEA